MEPVGISAGGVIRSFATACLKQRVQHAFVFRRYERKERKVMMGIRYRVLDLSKIVGIWTIMGMVLVLSGCTSKDGKTPTTTTTRDQHPGSPTQQIGPITTPATNSVRPATLVVAVRVVKPHTHITISVDGVIVLDGIRETGWSGRYTPQETIRIQTTDETAIESAAQGTAFVPLGMSPGRPITFEYLR